MKIGIRIIIQCESCDEQVSYSDSPPPVVAVNVLRFRQERLRREAINAGWKIYTNLTPDHSEIAYCPNCKRVAWHAM